MAALRLSPALLFAALLALLLVAWAPDAVTGAGVFFTHDLRHHHLPWRAWAAGEWTAGRLPLWAPGAGLGFPLMADGQTGALYPPNMLLFALLPAGWALSMALLGHLWWAGLGAFALARARGLRGEAAALCGVAFALSGFLVTKSLYLGFQNAAAWLPWVLWATSRRRWGAAGGASAMMLLAGHPQAAAFGLLLAGAFAVRERAWPFFAAAGLALLVASPQLVATLELARFSLRDGGLDPGLATAGSLPPQELLNGVLPTLFGAERPIDVIQTYYHRGPVLPDRGYWGAGENFWEMSFYLGIPVVFLAVWGLRRAPFWAGVAAVSALLMLGGHTPLWPALRHIPGLDGFRFPVRFGLLLTLAVDVLAAAGLHQLLTGDEAGRRRAGRGALAAAVGVMVGAGVVGGALSAGEGALRGRLTARYEARLAAPPPAAIAGATALERAAAPQPEPMEPSEVPARVERVVSSLRESTSPGSPRVWVPAALLLGLGLALRARPRLAGGVVVALVAVDLLGFAWDFYPLTPRAEVEAPPHALSVVRSEAGRVTTLDRRQDPALDTALMPASLGLLWGTSDVIVPSPLRVVRAEALLQKVGLDVGDRGLQKAARLLAHLPLVELLGVRWLLSVHDLDDPRVERVSDGEVKLYRVPGALPRAFLVGCARPVDGAEAAWEALDALEPASEAVVEGALTAVGCAPGAAGSARISAESPQRIVVEVEASRPALLVQTDSFYPGWEATVDGAPTPIVQTDLVFRGIEIMPGRHTVALVYRPPWLLPCGGAALFGLVGLGAMGLSRRRERRGARGEAPPSGA